MDAISLFLNAVGVAVQAARWGLSLVPNKSQRHKRDLDPLPRLTIPEGQPASPDFDICFVHGLTRDSDSTWTWDSENTEAENVRWPTDFLANETRLPDSSKPFPRPRILLYEYDTDVNSLAWLTARTLYYHATLLLEKLSEEREDRNRPLLFVAHSLGGLLVKNALVFSHRASGKEPEADDEDIHDIGDVYRSTFGIVSFGVPQSFARNTRLTELVNNLCSRGGPLMPFFQDFRDNRWKRDVDTLQRRLTEYHPLAQEIPELFCFESIKNTNPISTIAMAAPPQFQGYVSKLSRCVSILRNHSDLAKFRTRDSVYWKLCNDIQVFYENAPDLLRERRERRKRKYIISEGPEISTSSSAMFQGSEFRVKSELPKKIHFIKVKSQSRAILLETVEQRLSMNRYAVLVGPRRSGKTSLAVEYAHQHKESYSSIFWLDARSERTLELSFVKIAHELQRHYDDNANQSAEPARYAKDLQDLRDLPVGKDQIPISEKDRKTTVLTVLNWFQCPGNKEWLLIYDDVEHSEAPCLREFLPAMKNIKSKRGYILITSRSDHANPSESKKHQVESSYSSAFLQLPRAFGPKPKPEPSTTTGVKEYFIDSIEVKEFSREESVALLDRSFEARSDLTDREKRDIKRQNLEDVADKLQNNPSDIAYAGAFISASDSPLLVPMILTDDLGQIAEVPKEYSFWYDACIMLGPGPIPVQLVERYFHMEKKVIDSSLKALECRGAVWIPDPNSGNFEIPQLTLRSRHQWLAADRGEAEKCAKLACNAAVDYLEYLSTEIGPEKPSAKESGEKTVLEHVDTCLNHYRDYRDIPCEWDILAQLCESYGFYSKAEAFYRAALGQRFRNKVTEAQASQGHKSDVSESALIDAWFKADDPAQNRALAFDSKSPAPLLTILSVDTQNSRKLRNEVALIRMQLSVSNFEDPNTQLKPKASGGAGKDSGSQARSDEELIAGCLRIMKEVEDRNEDRYVSLKAEVMQQMVLVSKSRRDWLAAVQWSRSLIATLEKLVGPKAEETMKAIQQLAEIRMDQADFSGAAPLLEHALLTYEQIFGGSHRKSIAVVERLARAYSGQGDLRRARDLYRRVVDARSREFGEHHIETAKAQESLAKVYIRMEDKKEAAKWYKQALDTTSMFGENTVEFEKMLESHRKLFEQLDSSASSSRS